MKGGNDSSSPPRRRRRPLAASTRRSDAHRMVGSRSTDPKTPAATPGPDTRDPFGGCQNVAKFVWAAIGLICPVAGALDAITQDHPGPATTVFGTVALLEESGRAKSPKAQVRGYFRGGRGTRTHKSFRTTVFKTVRLPVSVALRDRAYRLRRPLRRGRPTVAA